MSDVFARARLPALGMFDFRGSRAIRRIFTGARPVPLSPPTGAGLRRRLDQLRPAQSGNPTLFSNPIQITFRLCTLLNGWFDRHSTVSSPP